MKTSNRFYCLTVFKDLNLFDIQSQVFKVTFVIENNLLEFNPELNTRP